MPRRQINPEKIGSQPLTQRGKWSLRDVQKALRQSGGMIAQAARILGISLQALHQRMNRRPELREYAHRVQEELVEQLTEGAIVCTSRAMQRALSRTRDGDFEEMSLAEHNAIKQGFKTKSAQRLFPDSKIDVTNQINTGPTMNVVLTPEVVRQLPRDVRARLLQGDPIEVDRIAEAAQGADR